MNTPKTVNEVLLQHPDERFEISDNEQGKQFMVEFGLSANIRPEIKYSGMQVITFLEHKTHYFMVLYTTGQEKASENGYLINCIPKSQYSPTQFHSFVALIKSTQNNLISINPLNKPAAN